MRNVPQHPGNVYPEGTTVDKDLQKQPWKGKSVSVPKLLKDVSSDTTQMFPEHIVNSTTEGGVSWISELLSKAISYHNNLPDPVNVREWTNRDLDRLPADQQQEWRQAQFEELEALKK